MVEVHCGNVTGHQGPQMGMEAHCGNVTGPDGALQFRMSVYCYASQVDISTIHPYKPAETYSAHMLGSQLRSNPHGLWKCVMLVKSHVLDI